MANIKRQAERARWIQTDTTTLAEALSDHMFELGLDSETVGHTNEIFVADKHGNKFIVKVESVERF